MVVRFSRCRRQLARIAAVCNEALVACPWTKLMPRVLGGCAAQSGAALVENAPLRQQLLVPWRSVERPILMSAGRAAGTVRWPGPLCWPCTPSGMNFWQFNRPSART